MHFSQQTLFGVVSTSILLTCLLLTACVAPKTKTQSLDTQKGDALRAGQALQQIEDIFVVKYTLTKMTNAFQHANAR